MAINNIRYLSKKLISLAKEKGLNYNSNMITNGLTLKPMIFEELVRDCLITHYQVTIDGTKEFHDKRRFLKNGNESFTHIYNNIKQITNSPFYANHKATILIRSNIDAENKDDTFELIEMLNKDNVLSKINFDVEQIHDWGDNKATQVNVLTKEEFAQFEIDVFLELIKYKKSDNMYVLPKRRHC
jgi:uncharacterized protein